MTRLRIAALVSCLLGSSAQAQNEASISRFFGFDFVLHPLAVKWACGGAAQGDLSRITDLIDAYPDDAARADVRNIVDVMAENALTSRDVGAIVGTPMTPSEVSLMCDAALALDIEWLTPAELTSYGNGPPPDQAAAWQTFFEVVEAL